MRTLLREHGQNRCFYCEDRIRGQAAVDHFIPWARYRLDLGHNYVLADARCNGDLTRRVAGWAYRQAERAGALVWSHGRDGMVRLDARWRSLLAAQ